VTDRFDIGHPPERIVCLTEETTELLYLLGEEDRIVGISTYTCRPERAKDEKPVVSSFRDASLKLVRELEPDLVIGFSDIQADIAKKLIADNQQVLIFNQRTIREILEVILLIARIVGAEDRGQKLVDEYTTKLRTLEDKNRRRSSRPKVYFEEWDDPMITAIAWVSELIGIAGGDDIFANRARGKLATERQVTSEEVIARSPDVYIASWCGKPLDRESVTGREGWSEVPAIATGNIHELDPSIILQPGPACLTDGVDALCRALSH